MTRPKLSDQETEFLRRRQEADARAIAAHNAAIEALAEAGAKRSDAIAAHDKLVAEAEARLKDARTALVEQLGPTAASTLGVALRGSTRGRKPRAVAPPPPPYAPLDMTDPTRR
jgi:hypothetical protein